MYLAVFLEKESPFSVVAGHSLGEYSALYAAGVITFDEGVLLTRRRGLYMKDSPSCPGSMMAVMGLGPEKVEKVFSAFPNVYIANQNFLVQTVISGEKLSLYQAKNVCEEMGASRVVELKVSAAFHTPFMEQAKKQMQIEIEGTHFREPSCFVIPNCLAIPNKDVSQIYTALIRQIIEKVLWMDTFLQQKP